MSETQNITEHRQELRTYRQSATKTPTTTEIQLRPPPDTSRRTDTIRTTPSVKWCFSQNVAANKFCHNHLFPSPSSRHRPYKHPPSSAHHHDHHHHHHHHLFFFNTLNFSTSTRWCSSIHLQFLYTQA